MTPEPPSVLRLGPDDSGRWLITTRDSHHILDLSRREWQRLPGPDSASFEHDGGVVRWTRIQLWPEVGGRMMLWFDEPDEPDDPSVLEHWRASSTIRKIEALAEEEEPR